MQSKIKKAFILAAGYGTRLIPLTNNTPKALVEYNRKPMIETAISKIVSAGIYDIIINIHHHADRMKEYFSERKGRENITLIEEPKILGTGGAIKNAENILKDEENFIVYNTDVYTDSDLSMMIEDHLSKSPLATLCVQNRKTSRYLLCNKDGEITGRVENGLNKFYKFNSNENDIKLTAFCGIHVINNRIFSILPPAESQYDIIPVYMSAINDDFIVNSYDITGFLWKDLGIPQNL